MVWTLAANGLPFCFDVCNVTFSFLSIKMKSVERPTKSKAVFLFCQKIRQIEGTSALLGCKQTFANFSSLPFDFFRQKSEIAKLKR